MYPQFTFDKDFNNLTLAIDIVAQNRFSNQTISLIMTKSGADVDFSRAIVFLMFVGWMGVIIALLYFVLNWKWPDKKNDKKLKASEKAKPSEFVQRLSNLSVYNKSNQKKSTLSNDSEKTASYGEPDHSNYGGYSKNQLENVPEYDSELEDSHEMSENLHKKDAKGRFNTLVQEKSICFIESFNWNELPQTAMDKYEKKKTQ